MKKLILAPYVRIGFLDDTLHFGFGSLGNLLQRKKHKTVFWMQLFS